MTSVKAAARGVAALGLALAVVSAAVVSTAGEARSEGRDEASMPVPQKVTVAVSAAANNRSSSPRVRGDAALDVASGFTSQPATRVRVEARPQEARSEARNEPRDESRSDAGAERATARSGSAAGSATRSGARIDDASRPVMQASIAAPKAATTAPEAAKVSSASGKGYGAHVARHAKAAGVPVALAMAVVRVESNYNPKARGRAGEVGLMQIKPQTARGMGYTGSTAALYDPETNLKWGMKYLAGAHRLAGGDTCGTIMRYQGGHYARRMSKAASAYCGKVKRHMAGSWT